MSELEFAIWTMVFIVIGLPILSSFIGGGGTIKDPIDMGNNGEKYQKQAENNAKLHKKLEKANLVLENILIKKEEIENEIEKLNFDSSMDYEIEGENATKIKKLELQLKHIEIKINDIDYNISNINREIKGIY